MTPWGPLPLRRWLGREARAATGAVVGSCGATNAAACPGSRPQRCCRAAAAAVRRQPLPLPPVASPPSPETAAATLTAFAQRLRSAGSLAELSQMLRGPPPLGIAKEQKSRGRTGAKEARQRRAGESNEVSGDLRDPSHLLMSSAACQVWSISAVLQPLLQSGFCCSVTSAGTAATQHCNRCPCHLRRARCC